MSVVINPILDYVPNDLRPYSDNTYKLGDNATPLRWAELHAFKGYFYDDVQVDGDATFGGNLNIGGNMLKTTHLLIKQGGSSQLWVRDVGDTTWSNIRAAAFQTHTGLISYANNTSISALDADDMVMYFKARDNGVGLVEIGRMVGADDPYFALGGSQKIRVYNSDKMLVMDDTYLCWGNGEDYLARYDAAGAEFEFRHISNGLIWSVADAGTTVAFTGGATFGGGLNVGTAGTRNLNVIGAAANSDDVIAYFKANGALDESLLVVDSIANRNSGVSLWNDGSLKWSLEHEQSDGSFMITTAKANPASAKLVLTTTGSMTLVGGATFGDSISMSKAGALEVTMSNSTGAVVRLLADASGYVGTTNAQPFIVQAGGATVMTANIDQSAAFAGNVGIGTSSPARLLDVAGDVRIRDTELLLTYNQSAGGIRITDNKFYIKNNSTDNLVIDSSGNVGIGTSSPASFVTIEKDNVDPSSGWTSNSQLVIQGASDTNKRLAIGRDSDSDYGYIVAYEDSSGYKNLALQPVGGNVGIGTTSPNNRLHVYDASEGALLDVLQIQNNGNGASGSGTGIILNTFTGEAYGVRIAALNEQASPTYQNAAMVFYTMADTTGWANLQERMRITSSGNVGIGTTSPSAPLHVAKDIGTMPAFVAGEITAVFSNNSLASDGCTVGIVAGTEQTAQIAFGDKDDHDQCVMGYSNSNSYWFVNVAGGNDLVIHSDGDTDLFGTHVGIGGAHNDSYALYVAGGDSYFGGDIYSNSKDMHQFNRLGLSGDVASTTMWLNFSGLAAGANQTSSSYGAFMHNVGRNTTGTAQTNNVVGALGEAGCDGNNTGDWGSGGDIRFRGVQGYIALHGTGTISGAASLFAVNPYVSGPTLSNAYGLYIENITNGTNNYAIYTEGGDSYFGGEVSIAGDLSLNDNTPTISMAPTGDPTGYLVTLEARHDTTNAFHIKQHGYSILKAGGDASPVYLNSQTSLYLTTGGVSNVRVTIDGSGTTFGGVITASYGGGHSSFGSTGGGNNHLYVRSSGGSIGLWAGGGVGVISTAGINFYMDETYGSESYTPDISFTSGGGATFGGNITISKAVGDSSLVISGGEGNEAYLMMYADQGDDNADKWNLHSKSAGGFSIETYATGSWADAFMIDTSRYVYVPVQLAVGKTTTPGYRIDASGNGAHERIKVASTATGGTAGIFMTGNGSSTGWTIRNSGDADPDLEFWDDSDSCTVKFLDGGGAMFGGDVGIGTNTPQKFLHIQDSAAVISGTQLTLEGVYGGYGAGISFQSRTSGGGTRVEMAKITADGEDSWNTTASTQDAGLRFFVAIDGVLTKTLQLNSSLNAVFTGGATFGGQVWANDRLWVTKTGSDAYVEVQATVAGAFFRASSENPSYMGFVLDDYNGGSIVEKWYFGCYQNENIQLIKDGRGGTTYMTVNQSNGHMTLGGGATFGGNILGSEVLSSGGVFRYTGNTNYFRPNNNVAADINIQAYVNNAYTTLIRVLGDTTVGKIGFFGATPAAQQTGVAVTAAGIHAALVNLGLITA